MMANDPDRIDHVSASYCSLMNNLLKYM